jgi:hypothetical protein
VEAAQFLQLVEELIANLPGVIFALLQLLAGQDKPTERWQLENANDGTLGVPAQSHQC